MSHFSASNAEEEFAAASQPGEHIPRTGLMRPSYKSLLRGLDTTRGLFVCAYEPCAHKQWVLRTVDTTQTGCTQIRVEELSPSVILHISPRKPADSSIKYHHKPFLGSRLVLVAVHRRHLKHGLVSGRTAHHRDYRYDLKTIFTTLDFRTKRSPVQLESLWGPSRGTTTPYELLACSGNR